MAGGAYLALLTMAAGLVLACAGGPGTGAVDIPGEGTTFLYRALGMRKAEVPGRFAAAVPGPGQDWSDAAPPRAHVRDGVCFGSASTRAAFDTSLRAAARAAPALDTGLVAWYTGIVEACADPSICAWATAGALDPDVNVRAVYDSLLVRCPGAGGVLSAPEGYGPALIAWVKQEEMHDRPVAWTDRLAAAVRETISRGQPADAFNAASAAVAVDEGRATPLLVELAGTLTGELRTNLLSGLYAARSPRLRALYCDERGEACPTLDPEPLASSGVPRPPTDPDGRSAWIAALDACVRAPDDEYTSAACLSALAEADRARAVAAAATLQPEAASPLKTPVANLLQYPGEGDFWGRLVGLGLVSGAPPADAGRCLELESLLAAGGRAVRFDSETGQFPNEHDALLRSLSRVVAPALDGVVFEELVPALGPTGAPTGPYTLVAYMDGVRYQTTAASNFGDWYDVGAVVGTLNGLLRVRGSAQRVALLPTGDQTALAIGAPGGALLAARDAGLLSFAGPTDPMKNGREFEDRVFDALKAEHQEASMERHVPALPDGR